MSETRGDSPTNGKNLTSTDDSSKIYSITACDEQKIIQSKLVIRNHELQTLPFAF